jgi:hypothetical protein
MSNKLFIIGIGGTGMRCIEALTHLCASGLFDQRELDVLSIDTDLSNGNKGRTEQLIDRYVRIRGGRDADQTSGTFFSAKINLFKFAPVYSGDAGTYAQLARLSMGTEEQRRVNKDLSDLLFDESVQNFQLDHGYRAQTHLGSLLMYHTILAAAHRVQQGAPDVRTEDRDLMDFVKRVQAAGADARVFILGSIFGGTGASSIPVIPRALRDAWLVMNSGNDLMAKYGCVLLTDYFEFKRPDAKQLGVERVIADSAGFARNSQAALMFYDADPTVRKDYQRMYVIGWPGQAADYSESNGEAATITGGGNQKNPAHVLELLSAMAAHDFFQNPQQQELHEVRYRTVERTEQGALQISFKDLAGQQNERTLRHRLGVFLALAHVTLAHQGGTYNLLQWMQKFNIHAYDTLSKTEVEDLDAYLRDFAYAIRDDGSTVEGWLGQVRRSVGPRFLFDGGIFAENQTDLRNFNFGLLYGDEQHQFAKGGFLKKGKPFDDFCKALGDQLVLEGYARPLDRYLAHCFKTLTSLYRFNA